MGRKKVIYKCFCGMDFGNKKDNYNRHINKMNSCLKNTQFTQFTPKITQFTQFIPKNETNILCAEVNKKYIYNDVDNNSNNVNNVNNKDDMNMNDKKIITKNYCQYCNKLFSRKYCLERHIKNNICKIKLNQNNNELIQNDNKLIEIDNKLNLILKQNEELKKENEKLKKQIKRTKTNINIGQQNINQQNINQQNININQNNILINFNDLDLEEIDKKLFIQPMMNARLQGKFIILQMIENVYINKTHPEYQNIMITDKNRGYVKIYNNGKWKTDNINIMNIVIDGIIYHSKNILIELKQQYLNNTNAKNLLNTSEKYVNLCDLEYLENLEDEQMNDNVDNKERIKRCKEFREMVFDDTINLFHDNKKILLKQ